MVAQELLLRCLNISLSQGTKPHVEILSSVPKGVTSVGPSELPCCVADADQTPEMVTALTSPS